MKRIHKLINAPKPLKWLFYGDSITHGAFHTFGARDYTELFSERIRGEMTRTQDVVIKTALSGNNTAVLLAEFDWRVTQFRPDVVFLMIGMNDCKQTSTASAKEFRRNLKGLCHRISNIGSALPVLQTTNLILPGLAPDREPQFEIYMDIVREVASDQDLPIIDHHRLWNESTKEQPELFHYWMSDAIHPNHFGHIVFAHFLLKELGIFDPHSMTCSLFHP